MQSILLVKQNCEMRLDHKDPEMDRVLAMMSGNICDAGFQIFYVFKVFVVKMFSFYSVYVFNGFMFLRVFSTPADRKAGLNEAASSGFAGGLGACHQQAENVWCITFSLLAAVITTS